jgi:hypothetical protein
MVWHFKVFYQPRLWQASGVVCGVMSILILWDEVVAWVDDLSLFGLVVSGVSVCVSVCQCVCIRVSVSLCVRGHVACHCLVQW